MDHTRLVYLNGHGRTGTMSANHTHTLKPLKGPGGVDIEALRPNDK